MSEEMRTLNELQTIRHSASHVLAQAVLRLYPGTKLAIGPAIDTGFYYDFDAPQAFTAEDLDKIEAEMKKIVKENLKIERFELPREEALALMKDEPYKVELSTTCRRMRPFRFISRATLLTCAPGRT